jgi:hypothetical protein
VGGGHEFSLLQRRRDYKAVCEKRKGEGYMRNIFAWRLSIVLLLASVAAGVMAQTSRAITSASYVERGNEWLKKRG